jgi:alkylation response protein AidB-like acyl-CoA dehydrogenase
MNALSERAVQGDLIGPAHGWENSALPKMDAARGALCSAVAALVPAMQARACALDEDGAFPSEDFSRLAEENLLLAAFPERFGGLGLGSEAVGNEALSDLLRLLGRGHLAIGRLFEAHVNAVALLSRYGDTSQISRAARDAAQGQLFGLWVTDPREDGLRADASGVLHGGKAFCSGAGYAGRAVVTAVAADGTTRLAYLSTATARAQKLEGRMQGVRAAMTGRVSFEGCKIDEQDWIGTQGDYLREPDFSAGAWRTSAVTCGGLEALTELAMRHLVARGRAADPHQQARMGRVWIAKETALLWLERAANAAKSAFSGGDVSEIVATVNFARIAIEAACLEAMTLIERSLGLAAFLHPDPIERVRRDLATYLRQPAPDDVLTEAAGHIFRTRMGAA